LVKAFVRVPVEISLGLRTGHIAPWLDRPGYPAGAGVVDTHSDGPACHPVRDRKCASLFVFWLLPIVSLVVSAMLGHPSILSPLRSRSMSASKTSAGLLMYRIEEDRTEVLLVHPGGPYFRSKDEGSWSIPKGEVEEAENLLEAAQREFREETGIRPTGPFIRLRPVKQKGGKVVFAWAFEGDCETSEICSNSFSMEWPPKSGRQVSFPEVDRADFFDLCTAKQKINRAQVSLLDDLEQHLAKA
jgi:predicted NUDIX family NTP pyrophosphohydrolase